MENSILTYQFKQISSFAEAAESRGVLENFPFFANPFVVSTFTAQKKPVE